MSRRPSPPTPSPFSTSSKKARGLSRQRGASLVVSLLVLTALTAIVASFAATQRVAYSGVVRRTEKLRAKRMAESGLTRALAELQTQTLDVPATLQDAWAVLGQYGSERFVVGRDSFRIEIVDAGARVNLNTADQETLYRLPLTTEQVDSLLDWRENNPAPRPEGAKDEWYTQLPEPYITAMRPLLSFDELLLVKGFDFATLYQPPTEERPNPYYVPGTQDEQLSLYDLATVESQAPVSGIGGVNKTNINNTGGSAQQFAQQLQQRFGIPLGLGTQIANGRPYARMGDIFQFPGVTPEMGAALLDNYVVGGAQTALGKINLNTAPASVLAAVPGITADIAEAIVARQSTGLQALGEITTIPGMTNDVLRQSVDAFTIASSMFIVRVVGQSGQTTYSLQALVSLGQNGPTIVKRIEPPYPDMRSYWRWDAEPTADVIVWERT